MPQTFLQGNLEATPLTYKWGKDSNEAAQLVAEGKLDHQEIAEKVGWSRVKLWRHRQHPEFKERVGSIVTDTAAALKLKGIAERQYRIDALVSRQHLLERVIEARAAAAPPRVERGEWVEDADGENKWKSFSPEDMPPVPGWDTGIMVHQIKVGKDRAYDEYAIDTGMLAEMRAHEKQVAQEVGQWSEKKELTGKDGGPIKGEFTWADLVALAAEDEA